MDPWNLIHLGSLQVKLEKEVKTTTWYQCILMTDQIYCQCLLQSVIILPIRLVVDPGRRSFTYFYWSTNIPVNAEKTKGKTEVVTHSGTQVQSRKHVTRTPSNKWPSHSFPERNNGTISKIWRIWGTEIARIQCLESSRSVCGEKFYGKIQQVVTKMVTNLCIMKQLVRIQ